MNGISCPRCEKTLPIYANYCANCGEALTSSQDAPTYILPTTDVERHEFQESPTIQASSPHGFASSQELQPAGVSTVVTKRNVAMNSQTTRETGPLHSVQDDVAQLHAEDARPLTWQRILDTPSDLEAIPVSPRPTSPRHMKVGTLRAKHSDTQPFPPAIFFWLSLAAVLIVSFAGLFGVFASFGRGSKTALAPTLTASSNIIEIGATVELYGTNFTPHGRVGLTRDAILPIADTGGASIIQADGNGKLKDTIIISPDWQTGIHTINAEDAKLHKIARFSLLVTGKSTSLRPAHFTISATSLNLGTGDSTTNSTQTLTLGNTGGGQITWQASTDAPWLVLSPDNGTIMSGTQPQVTVAVDRANLRPGTYTAHINFLSNVGSEGVTVTMQVIPLVPGHEAVFQLSPAALTFTAPDGGAAPPAQTLILSNPGALPLHWSASTNAAWLTVSPKSGTVTNGGTIQSIRVSINTSTLLPGPYTSMITFMGQGQVKNNPQTILVTTTITPPCSLQVSPSLLSFAGVYQQPVPVSKTINVGTSQNGCTTPLQWSATTTSSWLVLGSSSGTTPAHPSVSVNSSGLQPGTYNSSIVFTTATGTQTLPVSFTVTQGASPTMNVSPAALTYTGVAGQVGPAPQSIVVTNSLGGVLRWQASVTTNMGGNWLSVTPSTGSLTSGQSAALSVSVRQFNTLTPGTYNGTVTLTGIDDAGHTVVGSPQVIPVSFIIGATCMVTTERSALTFTSVVGQVAVPTQPLTIAASGSCTHGVTWAATSAANWLIPTPASGTATLAHAGRSSIGVASSALKAGNYTSTVTVTAIDSATHQALGAPVIVSVTLLVQQACTLQAPSVTTESFTTITGRNPVARSFSLAVNGVCTGNVTITPTVTLDSGAGWLTVTPTTTSVVSGGTATFTVTVNGKMLHAGSYGGSIMLSGSNGGVSITGSPRTVGITVTVASPASLSASAGAASTHGTNGVTTQPVNIVNMGNTSLNWTASLSKAPSFVSLSTVSGTLTAGSNTAIGVSVNTTYAVAGNYTANVTITAIDPTTGLPAIGSPVTVTIAITIASPSMQVNTTNLNYSTHAGTNPAAQLVNISNIGGGTLTWTVGTPSASWLSVRPKSGSDTSNVTSSSTFKVNSSNLAAGTYTATVAIIPSVGSAVTVTITLTVTAVATPTPTPNPPTPTPTTSPPTPTPTIAPKPTATPTTVPKPTPTPTTLPTPTPTAKIVPTPTSTTVPTPTPTAKIVPTPTSTIGPTPTKPPRKHHT